MGKSLKDKAVSGVAWTSVEKFSQQIIQFVIGVSIARLLNPQDYGVIGMTSIFFAIASTFIDSGFGNALIQKKDRNEEDYSTCFYFNVLVGIIIYIILWFAAPYIAMFYATPILCDVIRVLGITLTINSLSISQTAKMTAEMKFKEMAIITIIVQLSTGVVGLYLAYAGWGIWALVFQSIASCVARLVLIEFALKWYPQLIFSKTSFRHMFSFGSKLLLASLISVIYDNMYTLVIGKAFSPKEVGYYNRGNQFAILPTVTLMNVFMKVSYPLMASVQEDTIKLKKAYKKFLRVLIFIQYPILFGLMVLAKPFIYVLLGEKWLPCVPVLQVLCICSFFDPLTHINLNVLYVKGRTDLVLKLEFFKKPIAFLLIFGMIPLGIWWLCFGRALYGLIAYSFNCYYTGKILNFGFWKQMYYNLPVVLKSSIMGLLCYCCLYVFENYYLQLFVGIFVGIVSYIAIAIASKDETIEDIKNILLKRHS